MAYRIQFRPAALKELRKLPKAIQRRIGSKINNLIDDPFPSGVKKLQTSEPMYRIRVGDYRVVYEVHSSILVVLILTVGHRGDVYQGL
jgi:mRNA interferase RelE/StbE